MSVVRRERSTRIRVPNKRNLFEPDESTQRRRTSPLDKTEKEQGEGSAAGGSGVSNIRTRLSTGTLHMNGTQTIKDIKPMQTSDDSNDSQKMTPAKDSPAVLGKKRTGNDMSHLPPKRRKIGNNDGSGEANKNDYFCWICHKEGSVICCELCPRVFHMKCLDMVTDVPSDWVCPECEKVMRAECVDSRSRAMAMISVDTLCFLLKFALERMKHSGCDPFMKPVDPSSVPHYSDYIFHPMDLGILERNIKKKMYGCTEAFLADSKWILHNCIIFNGLHNKLTSAAKTIIKICRHEMSEIEVCPDCYLNSCVKKNDEWFCEPCREPHPLVWAKLKGYPFWQAKALREKDGLVDVRFFGAHDRSWVPTSQVFMLSKEIPTPMRNKRQSGFDNATDETNLHIQKLREKFGHFEYAPFRTPYDASKTYSPMKKRKSLQPSPKKKPHLPSQSNFPKSSHSFNVMKRRTIDPKSSITKTASAVRQKYSSINTTRKITVSVSKSPVSTKVEQCISPEAHSLQDPALNVCGVARLTDKVDNVDKEKSDSAISKAGSEDGEDEIVAEKFVKELLDKDVSSDDDSVNLLDDRVLDSSSSENTSPGVVKKSIEECHIRLGIAEESEDKQEVEEVNDSGVIPKEPDSVSDEAKKSETKEKEDVEETTIEAEAQSNPSSDLLEKESKFTEAEIVEDCLDGRQTPTDSVDGEIMCTAKGGKVNPCVRVDDSLSKASAQSEKDVKSREDSVVEECAKEPVSEENKGETDGEKGGHESDLELPLEMEVETESDPDHLVIDLNEERKKNSPLKIMTSSKKTPQTVTSQPKTSIIQEELTKTKDPGAGGTQQISLLSGSALKTATVVSKGTFVPPKGVLKPNVPEAEKTVEKRLDKVVSDSGDMMKVAMFRPRRVSKSDDETSGKNRSSVPDVEVLNDDDEVPKKDLTDQTKSVIDKYKSKLMAAMKSTLDEMCTDLEKSATPSSGNSNKHYQLELEKLRWIHLQEVAELKHNFKLTVMEMRSAWDAEKQRLFKDISKLCEKEKNKAIAETKKKQWCANCGKEAIYYCCWNTSYCTYECQQANWPNHMPSCMQTLSTTEEQEKNNQSKSSPSSTSSSGTKEDTGKKGSPPVSKQSEWTEKDEAIQAQRAFNLAPPTVTGPNNTPTTSPQAGTWRNRARDNLEQVLRRQEDPSPSQTVYIPPQIIPGPPAQPTGAPFIQGGEAVIQYIQGGQPQAQAVHLPPSSLPNFTQPPQVRLQGYPGPQGPGPASSLLQNVSGYPILRQQQPPQMATTAGGGYLPRNQIFLAPNAQNSRPPHSMSGPVHFQIRPR